MKCEHMCHVPGCDEVIKPESLMCRFHWCKVSAKTQREVLNNYTPGQCNKKMRPTKEWLKAARKAINEARGIS